MILGMPIYLFTQLLGGENAFTYFHSCLVEKMPLLIYTAAWQRKCHHYCTYLHSSIIQELPLYCAHSGGNAYVLIYTAAWWRKCIIIIYTATQQRGGHSMVQRKCLVLIYTAAHKRNCLCSYLHSSMVNEMPLYLQYIHRKCLHSYFHGGLIQQRKMPLYLFTPRHGRGNAFILTIYTQEMPTFLFTRRPYTVEENAFVLIYTTAWQRKCLCTYLHNSMVEEMPLFIFTQRHCRKTRKCLRTYLHHDCTDGNTVFGCESDKNSLVFIYMF